jgi:hypothetical protein
MALASQIKQLPTYAATVAAWTNQEAMLDAVKEIRKLLSLEDNPPIAEVIATGVVKVLVELLGYTQLPRL